MKPPAKGIPTFFVLFGVSHTTFFRRHSIWHETNSSEFHHSQTTANLNKAVKRTKLCYRMWLLQVSHKSRRILYQLHDLLFTIRIRMRQNQWTSCRTLCTVAIRNDLVWENYLPNGVGWDENWEEYVNFSMDWYLKLFHVNKSWKFEKNPQNNAILVGMYTDSWIVHTFHFRCKQ